MKTYSPIPFLCVPEYKNCIRSELSSQFSLTKYIFSSTNRLKIRGSKKGNPKWQAMTSSLGKRHYHDKPTAATPLGSGFLLPRYCPLFTFSILHSLLLLWSVFLQTTQESFQSLTHSRSLKRTFQAPSIALGK